MTTTDIDKYLNYLQSKIDGKTISFAQNDDGAHNAAVMISMLRNASSIYMFCGAASVFSERFYRNISEDTGAIPQFSYDQHLNLNVVYDYFDPAKDIGKYLRDMMDTSLDVFLSDDSKLLNIIVEDKKKMATKTFLPAVKNNTGDFKDNVKIYGLKDPDFFRGLVDHFSYAMNGNGDLFMARMENDGKSHKADCIFYPTDVMRDSLMDTFSNFASVSSKL